MPHHPQTDPWQKIKDAEANGDTLDVVVKSLNKGGFLRVCPHFISQAAQGRVRAHRGLSNGTTTLGCAAHARAWHPLPPLGACLGAQIPPCPPPIAGGLVCELGEIKGEWGPMNLGCGGAALPSQGCSTASLLVFSPCPPAPLTHQGSSPTTR